MTGEGDNNVKIREEVQKGHWKKKKSIGSRLLEKDFTRKQRIFKNLLYDLFKDSMKWYLTLRYI